MEVKWESSIIDLKKKLIEDFKRQIGPHSAFTKSELGSIATRLTTLAAVASKMSLAPGMLNSLKFPGYGATLG